MKRDDWMVGIVAVALAVPILALAVLLVVVLTCCGCCNIMVRTEKPYLAAPDVYYCTASVAEDAVAAPFKDRSGEDAIMDAIFTLTWPVWLVDLPCEFVLDTVFLPVDAAARK